MPQVVDSYYLWGIGLEWGSIKYFINGFLFLNLNFEIILNLEKVPK